MPEETKSHAPLSGVVERFFTQSEVEAFMDGSINYPHLIVEKEHNEVIEVSEVVMLGGMADNNGTPDTIGIQVHRKGEPTRHLTYKLVDQR